MKVLIVCESSYKFESGGRVVRFLTKILNVGNHEVKILVLDRKRDDYYLDSFYEENDVEFFPLKRNVSFRMAKLVFRTRELKKYRQILDNFKPEIVHFASFDHLKPVKFLTESKRSGAKVILQPWTMHFFCAQGFGFRNGHNCDLCVTGSYLNAITKNCTSIKNLPTQIERQQVHRHALKADVFLSSNTDLDLIMEKYGVKNNKISRFPVPFDCSFVEANKKVEENYFIFYGQANDHKGLNVLLNIFETLPEKKLKIYPLADLNEQIYGRHNIEIVNKKNWKNGLKEAIINAKVVLIPSLWSTSTEYAMCEALLLRKPIVVFNVGVHKDIFKHKFNAMVAEPDDFNAYRQSIIELDENEFLRNQIAENGFNTLVELNDIKQLHSKLTASYSI